MVTPVKDESSPVQAGCKPGSRIALVDDDEWVRFSTARLLRAEGYQVDCYESGDAFLQSGDAASVDVVLLDMQMPGSSGIDTLRALGKGSDRPCILMLSGHGDVGLAVQAMKLGALDFIEKPASPKILVSALDQALSHHASKGAKAAVRKAACRRLEQLSDRQRQVLARMVEGRPNKLIAFELGLSIRTVEAYRAQLLDKLGVRSTAEAVRIAIDAGMIGI
jgi:two-component system response regulator FixJ